MWSAILLFVRKAYLKHKLKKEKLKEDRNELKKRAKAGDSKEIKKLKRKIFFLNCQIVAAVIIPIIAALITMLLFIQTFLFISSVASKYILKPDPDALTEEEKEKNWSWQTEQGVNNTGIVQISGGIYPKDPILKNRAIYMEVLKRSAEDASKDCNINFTGADLLGILMNETGGASLLNSLDSNKDTSWLTDLRFTNPACNKGSGCKWLKGGVSHFIGGTVVNGKDSGDPYTQKVQDSKDIYDRFGGNHAAGFFQHEVKYVNIRLGDHLYPIDSLGVSESSLNFNRPNFFYIPDQTYMSAYYCCTSTTSNKYCKKLMSSSEYNSATDANKRFAVASISASKYNAGHVKESNVNYMISILALANSNNIDLQSMLVPVKDLYYKRDLHNPYRPSNTTIINYMISTYGIPVPSDAGNMWYGIKAICMGYAAWGEMQAEVDAAEKEQTQMGSTVSVGGNWIDYIGSGKFNRLTPKDGKNYYSESVECTLFQQWNGNGTFATPWSYGKISAERMEEAGCGIYSLAFCITNLTGTIVTPQDVLKKGIDEGLFSSGLIIPLPDGDMIKIAKAYGLDAFQFDTTKMSDDEFRDRVIEQLKDGGLIQGVWWSARRFKYNGIKGYDEVTDPFEWYNSMGNKSKGYDGGAHFMVIRGYNNTNNKLRVFTSTKANAGSSLEEVCNKEVDAGRVKKFLSNSHRDYMVVIKPKGGVASLAPSQSGTSSLPAVKGTNYSGTMGAGTFNNPNGSGYYSKTMGCILFPQSKISGAEKVLGIKYPEYATTLQKKQFYDSSGSFGAAGIYSCGCPAYAAANLLSNLMGVEILPDKLPYTVEAEDPWEYGNRNLANGGYGDGNFINTLNSVNRTLEKLGYSYRLKYKSLTRSELESKKSYIYQWFDYGAMAFARVPNHSIVVAGYDKSEYNSSTGNYTLKLINSIVVNTKNHPYITGNGQKITVGDLDKYGIKGIFDSSWKFTVVWRTDVADTLPGL